MNDDARRPSRVPIAHLAGRAALPQAPLAMPKQVLETQHSWIVAIYARFVRRTQ